MPNMFSRRRASSAQAPVDRSTQLSATAAASQAFLASPPSHGSLSSAAAASALRSQTTSPEPIGNIQTKRMIRRNSNASVGSGSVIGSSSRGGIGRGGLLRQNSGGSMTERTFRSPSPRGSRSGAMSPDYSNAPPVPKLPAGSYTTGRGQRSSSVEPPARVISPTPTRGNRGVSVDRGSSVSIASPTSRQKKRLSDVPEFKSEDINSATNFSRPRTSGNESAGETTTKGKSSWFSGAAGTAAQKARPVTSDGLPTQKKAKPAAIKTAPQNKRVSQGGEGSHFSKASRGSGALSPAISEGADTVMVYDANSRSFVPRARSQQPESPQSPVTSTVPETVTTYDPNSRKIVTKPKVSRSDNDSVGTASDSEAIPMAVAKQRKKRPVVTPVETDLEPPPRNPARVSSTSPSSPRSQGHLHKQPSIVREEPEEEEEGAAEMPAQIQIPTKQSVRSVSNTGGPPKAYVVPTTSHQRSVSLDVPNADRSARGRANSSSPSRSLHFSQNPIIGGMRHAPPPRSYSPQKSAMKHSPASSIRTVSPMATFSPATTKAPPSDTSESNSLDSQDVLGPRKKKSARVSFNDKPAEVLSTPADSRRTAREISPAVDDDMDEVMQPRPALPSFGSVRKNSRPEIAEKVTEQPPDRHAHEQQSSNDFVIGSVLANHHAQKADAEQEQPLPPEATSKEGTGYVSEESDEAFEPTAASTPAQTLEVPSATKTDQASYDKQYANGEVPGINLLPPTPGLDEDHEHDLTASETETAPVQTTEATVPSEPSHPTDAIDTLQPEEAGPTEPVEPILAPLPPPVDAGAEEEKPAMRQTTFTGNRLRYSVPGGWEEPDEGSSKNEPETTASKASNVPASLPTAQTVPQTAPQTTPQAVPESYSSPAMQEPVLEPILDESDASESSAMFSDAEEDLSYLDDGGFASLDAIVESPVVHAPDPDEPDESPSKRLTNKIAQKAARENDKPSSSKDWSEATAYWSKLSRQQKLQIEREALSSDDELRAPPVARKTSKKKKRKSMELTKQAAAAREEANEEDPDEEPLPRKSTTAKSSEEQPRSTAIRTSMRGAAPQQPQAQQEDGEVRLRKSMRNGGAAPMSATQQKAHQRSRSEQMEPRQTLQKKAARPQSTGGQLTSSGLPASALGNAMLANQRKSQPPPSKPQVSRAAIAQAQKSTANNDSDSESSFRKSKRRGSNATVESQGRYSMKRSMRGASSEEPPPMPEQRAMSPNPATRGKGAWSIRSLSPAASNTGRQRENIRTSLRGSSIDAGDARTLRGPPAQQQPRSGSKSRFSGFGRSNKAPEPAHAPKSSKPRFSSRFGNDSDDSDGGNNNARGGGRVFKSRFADSDEEEEAAPPALAAVRGIPKRNGRNDGDSTELSDEEEDDPRKDSRRRQKQSKPGVPDPADVEKAMAAARRNLGMIEPAGGAGNGNGTTATGGAAKGTEGSALGKGSLRTSGAPDQGIEEETDQATPMSVKRRGFMGSILRRNRGGSSNSIPQVGSQETLPQASPQVSSPGKLTRRASQQAPASIRASSFTNAGRTSSMTAASKPYDLQPTFRTPAKEKPELNTKSSFDRQRPQTSDGNVKMARTMRPEGLGRSVSGYDEMGSRAGAGVGAGAEQPEQAAVYSEKTGKKKRFGRLRRVFGLND